MTPDFNPLASCTPPEAAPIPEHMVVLLLEGGQRHLAKAQEAIRSQNPMVRDHHINKVLGILTELVTRLNHEQGSDLVDNLVRVYDWWGREVVEAGVLNDEDRLKVISSQMGEIRKSWEQVLFQGEGLSENPEF